MTAFIIWDIAPNIFPNFDFVRWYGLFWLFGIMLAYRIMKTIFQSESVPLAELDKLATYLILGGILGARLGHILFYDPIYYWNNPIEILPFKINPTFQFTGLAGLASHGGILGSLLALYLFTKKHQNNYLWLLDRLTIAFAGLGGFIRLGNLMNSEIVGLPTDLPWAFVFTRVDMLPRHPAQLYEAIFYFAICLLLFWVWKSYKPQISSGFLFGLGLTLIFLQRFFVEFLKENQVAFESGLTLKMGQTLSIPFIVAGIMILIWILRRRPLKTSSEEHG